MAKTKPLTLSEEERSQLETITRTRTLQAQVVSRARILLLKSDGYSVDAIAEKVDLISLMLIWVSNRERNAGLSFSNFSWQSEKISDKESCLCGIIDIRITPFLDGGF